MTHHINIDASKSGIREAIDVIREAQNTGAMGYGYIFTHSNWLAGGVWFDDAPPLAHEWYIVVPPDGQPPYFRNGIDSMQHLDHAAYLEWIKHLIDIGAINW